MSGAGPWPPGWLPPGESGLAFFGINHPIGGNDPQSSSDLRHITRSLSLNFCAALLLRLASGVPDPSIRDRYHPPLSVIAGRTSYR